MNATIWSLLPPILAIVLALWTKEVYVSLLLGILLGALLFTGFHPIDAIQTTFQILGDKVGGNINIIVFLVLLGVLVALITKSGASTAYKDWASKSIHSRRGALLSTIILGLIIFVDDYFNCLTVGTVMRPVTDKFKVTRAKLAYVIDATAAPICIIAPISSWAAAVSSSLPENSKIDGFTLFLNTIPFNFYALLTLVFLLFLVICDMDFSTMLKYEQNLRARDEHDALEEEKHILDGKGTVWDLVLPIFVLISCCLGSMLYTGSYFSESKTVAAAFADCDSSASLVLGSFLALLFTAVLYLPRRVILFEQFADSFVEGFKAMASANLILAFAWTLSGICSGDYLNIGGFVKSLISPDTMFLNFLPAAFFAIALGLAFATGTSWGTFGILIPIALAIFSDELSPLLILTVSAVLSGAVCGDHISPISDTTILASAGSNCHHIDHVSTQLPYALTVAGCSLVGYLVAGYAQNGWIGLVAGFIVLVIACLTLYKRHQNKLANNEIVQY